MIWLGDLKPIHVGQWVRWQGGHPNHWEEGRIKSWNQEVVFVVFKCDNNWDRFQDYTGQACDPDDTTFINIPTKNERTSV
jgi:hypothetical protein